MIDKYFMLNAKARPCCDRGPAVQRRERQSEHQEHESLVPSMVISPRISFSLRMLHSTQRRGAERQRVECPSRSSISRAPRKTEPRRMNAVTNSMTSAALESDR